MNSKQRAYLRSMCNTLPAILLVGKEGVTENTLKSVSDALEARELIKCGVQRGAPMDAREACSQICEGTGAEPVQCIGSKFCIYRPKEKDPVIVLP
jgi:RNA-binding protein